MADYYYDKKGKTDGNGAAALHRGCVYERELWRAVSRGHFERIADYGDLPHIS